MDIISFLKSKFDFLIKDYFYSFYEEEDKNIFKSIKYINKENKLLVSIVYDIRENYIDTSIWQLKDGKPNIVDRGSYVYLKDLIQLNNDTVELIQLPEINKKQTIEGFQPVIDQNIDLFKKHASDILRGQRWVRVPWSESHNQKYPTIIK